MQRIAQENLNNNTRPNNRGSVDESYEERQRAKLEAKRAVLNK